MDFGQKVSLRIVDFLVDFSVDFFLLVFPKRNPQKNPPRKPNNTIYEQFRGRGLLATLGARDSRVGEV